MLRSVTTQCLKSRTIYNISKGVSRPAPSSAALLGAIGIIVLGLALPLILNLNQVAAAGEPVVVQMPFAGRWAWNAPNVPQPWTDSNTSYPAVHHLPGGGHSSTDLYPLVAGEPVILHLKSPNNRPISLVSQSSETTCGQSVQFEVRVDNSSVGVIYIAHLATVSGTIANGQSLGTVGTCNGVAHIHIELKNTAGDYACWTDHGAPGASLVAGTSVGVLGAKNNALQQACAPGAGDSTDPDPYVTFQSNTNHLHAFHTAAQSTTLGLAPGTSPSTTKLSDGSCQTAFQANNGNLYVYNSANGGSATDLGYSMAPGSSPAIGAFPGGGWQIAYRKNYIGHLSLYNSTNGNQDLTLGLASGSSPSIAVLSNTAFQVAFQSNTGTLYVYNNNSGAGSLSQGLAANTSPAITALSTGTWQIAFQSNTNNLYTYNWPSVAGNLNAGMAANTSPAIASLSSSAYQIAFQANTGTLHVHNNSSGTANLGLGMYAGTNPSIAAKDAGSWQAVMQANTGNLFKYYFNLNGTGSSDMGQGMSAGTSPAITF